MIQPPGQVSPDGKWLWNGTEWVPFQPVSAPPPLVSWARPFESASFRAMFLTVFLLANAAGLCVGIIFDIVFISSGAGMATLSDTQTLVIGVLSVAYLISFYGTLVPSVVLFCMWLHRVVRNMPSLGSWDVRWSPSGAVVRCFIPFLNLAHPMSGTLEAWRSSDPSRRWVDVVARTHMRPPALIVIWWTAWLVGGIMSRVSFQVGRSNDPSALTASTWLDLISGIVLIAAAGLAVLVVRGVTARQNRKNELILTGHLA